MSNKPNFIENRIDVSNLENEKPKCDIELLPRSVFSLNILFCKILLNKGLSLSFLIHDLGTVVADSANVEIIGKIAIRATRSIKSVLDSFPLKRKYDTKSLAILFCIDFQT